MECQRDGKGWSRLRGRGTRGGHKATRRDPHRELISPAQFCIYICCMLLSFLRFHFLYVEKLRCWVRSSGQEAELAWNEFCLFICLISQLSLKWSKLVIGISKVTHCAVGSKPVSTSSCIVWIWNHELSPRAMEWSICLLLWSFWAPCRRFLSILFSHFSRTGFYIVLNMHLVPCN